MAMILSVLAFVAIGAVIGFLGGYFFERTQMVLSLALGLIGSFGLSWVASLLGLGSGFLAFSLWGVIAGIVGACLLVGVYGLLTKRMAA